MSQKVNVTKRTVEFIEKFCEAVHKKRKFRDAKNNDSGKRRIKNEITGKIGEFAAWAIYGGTKPDFNLYENGKVNFDGDLGPGKHVKTCHIKYRGRDIDSWTADKKDPIVFDPTDDDMIILVYADEKGTAYIEGHVKASDVKKFWKPTRNIPHKVAIYRDDIEEFIQPYPKRV